MHRADRAREERSYEGGGEPTAWPYVMMSRDNSRLILERIVSGSRPLKTLSVWEAVRTYAEWNTGEITASVSELADTAKTTPTEVYRALSRLVEVGALVRVDRGRYAISPQAAWAGSLASREGRKAELRLV